MARASATLEPVSLPRVPPLENGDRLTRAEFHRRYEATPDTVWAQLIEGVVYVSSPVRARVHGRQSSQVNGWLQWYATYTPGTEVCDNTTVQLDGDNEPQPDVFLRILPECGGQSDTVEGYVAGAPEFVAEVAASSASIGLHGKMNAYRRNGVREYLVWRVLDGELDFFALREGRYERMAPDGRGITRSEAFPGLWLDAAALLRSDMATVLRVLQDGLNSPEHAEFITRLRQAGPLPHA